MNEFLRVGRSITSVDRRFTAMLESDCNFVVFHSWGGGRTKVRFFFFILHERVHGLFFACASTPVFGEKIRGIRVGSCLALVKG